jgi:hypothetical protein
MYGSVWELRTRINQKVIYKDRNMAFFQKPRCVLERLYFLGSKTVTVAVPLTFSTVN